MTRPVLAPSEPPPASTPLAAIAELLRGRRLVALTGAGCSTESGIPDYRGEGARYRSRTPIQHREFVTRASVRQRYWARSMLGWPQLAAARPNAAHEALAGLERAGLLAGVLTQNVDRLHQAAGSARVLELHGALAAVRCLACGAEEPREVLQHRLAVLNPALLDAPDALARPDGDAELASALEQAFRVPDCLACGGVLMPAVVFFGGTVPRAVVDEAFALLDEGDALLVAGTSLAVFSGYRFALRARDRGVPVVVLNRGPTRADGFAAARNDGALGAVLPALRRALESPAGER